MQCQLFDSFVGSILNYAIEVWCIGTFYIGEKVCLNLYERFLSVTTSTNTWGIMYLLRNGALSTLSQLVEL